jgi:hypothetical protein
MVIHSGGWILNDYLAGISMNIYIVPLAAVIYIGLGALYMPIIIRGHVWEEEVIEVKETNLWRA